jgi:hypothetical protein
MLQHNRVKENFKKKFLLFYFIFSDQGWYIYMETSGVNFNDTARLQSPAIAGSTTKCFEFWYHMHGPDINRLDVLIIDSSNVETTIWTRQGPQGNMWRLGKIKLNDITDMYNVCK